MLRSIPGLVGLTLFVIILVIASYMDAQIHELTGFLP